MSARERPNFVFILTDQERFQPGYESASVKAFMASLPGHLQLRETGVEFMNHYTASCACTPSRACLYTGQYPSLHGITQTYGGAKAADDPRLVWLEPYTIPTMGNYFQAAGYETRYIGKWHLSHEDLHDEETGYVYPTTSGNEAKDCEARAKYRALNPLDKFGFSGWVGPEPHGPGMANSGWRRDGDFVRQFAEFMDEREQREAAKEGPLKPFLVVVNLVNPHDIVHFPYWLSYGMPTTDGTVPEIPAPPTHHEDLGTKPSTQLSYRKQYRKLFFPDIFEAQYRQLYYYLHKAVDREIHAIYTRLASSRAFSNTYTVLTSDHGDLLGAHGGLKQKWYNAYEETLHVPLIISHPSLRGGERRAVPTSSVDLIPTLLGLAGVSPSELYSLLGETHSAVHPLVGTDLSRLVVAQSPRLAPSFSSCGEDASHGSDELERWLKLRPVYSQVEDHVTQGDVQVFIGARGKASLLLMHHFEHDAVQGPASIEAVMQYVETPHAKGKAGGRLKDKQQHKEKEHEHHWQSNSSHDDLGELKLWKLVRYWDNPAHWSHPGQRHEEVLREGHVRRGKKVARTMPLADEYELYCLTDDPGETRNLAHLAYSDSVTEEVRAVRRHLEEVLAQERQRKALKLDKPLPRARPKKLPAFLSKSQKEDSLKDALIKMLSFPTPDPHKPKPYSKL